MRKTKRSLLYAFVFKYGIKMKFIVIGYYTRNTFYEDHSQVFAKSMDRLDIPYYLEAIDDLGGWILNCGYKPTFIKRMMKKFPDCNIVYVDVDAEFLAYPELFDELDCDVAVHYFDRRNHPKITVEAYEVLSGTIFLKNVKSVFEMVERWESECRRRPGVWDQRSLEKILHGDFYHLPAEYCKIFNLMPRIKNVVIVHYQASRTVRANRGNLKKCVMNQDVVSGSFPKAFAGSNSSTRPDSPN